MGERTLLHQCFTIASIVESLSDDRSRKVVLEDAARVARERIPPFLSHISVYKVVLKRSIPAQIRQLTFHISNNER